MSDSEYSEIDSDDDFIKCYECEIEVDVAEVCFYKKDKFCKSCYEECIQFEIAQPVRMIVKVCEDMSLVVAVVRTAFVLNVVAL